MGDRCGCLSVCFLINTRTFGIQIDISIIPMTREKIPWKKGNTSPNNPDIMKIIPTVKTIIFFPFFRMWIYYSMN